MVQYCSSPMSIPYTKYQSNVACILKKSQTNDEIIPWSSSSPDDDDDDDNDDDDDSDEDDDDDDVDGDDDDDDEDDDHTARQDWTAADTSFFLTVLFSQLNRKRFLDSNR